MGMGTKYFTGSSSNANSTKMPYLIFDVSCTIRILQSVQSFQKVTVRRRYARNHSRIAANDKQCHLLHLRNSSASRTGEHKVMLFSESR